MPGMSFDRSLTVHDVGRIEVRINVHKPWEKHHSHIQRLLPEEIYASDLWTSQHPLVTQQILTGGPCFTLVPKGFISPSHWLPQNHAAYIKGERVGKDQVGSQAMRVGYGTSPDKFEVFLVPINALQGKANKPVPAFLGYIVHQGVTFLADKFLQACWLPIILDLDETLLVANSAHQLSNQIFKAESNRDQAANEASAAATTEARASCEQRWDAFNHEMQSLEQDLALLKQYREDNAVTDPRSGQIHRAKYETAKVDGNVLQRPVVRLGGIFLTRIDPAQKDTSMIMRIRPGWEALRAFLAPDSKGKRRFDVYVCTAAERGYALEAWRLLDSGNDIIPDEARSARVVCSGGQKKELRKVLRVQTPIKFESEGAAPEAACAMPMAIIVDDRLDVWEPESQQQVLQVLPFAPHRPIPLGQGQMSNPLARQVMVDEMTLVKDRMTAIRGHVFFDINQRLKPAVTRLMLRGDTLDHIVANLSQVLPPVRTVAELLKVPNLTLPQLPVAAAAPAPPMTGAPAFAGNDSSLLPHDPGNPQKGPGMQPLPQQRPSLQVSQLPVDPRKPLSRLGAPSSQPLARPGTGPSQPSFNGPAGIQPWRPSPSFREQQQQQPAASTPHASTSHQVLNGSTVSTDPPQLSMPPSDPRRISHQQQRQQQRLQEQQAPVGSSGQQAGPQGMNGFHAVAAGQWPTGPGAAMQPGAQAAEAVAPGAASRSPPTAGLHLDIALPLIRKKCTWLNCNPVSLLKEAADRQKVVHKCVDRTLPPRSGSQHQQYRYQTIVTWEGKEIGSSVDSDKKAARRKAALSAIELLLQHPPEPAPVASEGPDETHPNPSASGSSPGQAMIREDNALATLQVAFPKEVKYRTSKGPHVASGKLCEAIDVMDGFHVAQGTTSTKQSAKRWAAMRLLQELDHVIAPAFFKDTADGQQRGSKGPAQAEFQAATEVLVFNGKPHPRRHNQPSTSQQSLQHQLPQQQQQQQQSEQAAVNTGRGQKRSAGFDAVPESHGVKRSKHTGQTLSRPTPQAGYLDDDMGDDMGHESAQPGDARDMSMEPPEQSGYPTDPDEDEQSGYPADDPDDEEDGYGDLPGGKTDGSGGSRTRTENDEPKSGVNRQSSSHLAFLAAVKKQTKVKEGDWSEVKQQYDGNDYEDGIVDID